ncbi:Alkaline phosphatase synthesis transcriptional regulatory protein SphR [Paraconexibacter sp. AEG42_29]|uniref:Alkaline phosphatase synthesis transcriptional regulatory protein SphR n=1 Tax=Paraconexibacter sp. AEG42_29 TaxID=2997339 RepID=A0AAU7AUB9_9ACTN
MIDDPRSTLLVIEDDPATRTFLADNLTADGYNVCVAGGVREGARELRTQFPDLVVLDVGLPDGSGLDLVRAVRRADVATQRVDPRTPMLVLSGRGDELDRIRGLEQGADDYLVKPFGYGELRCRVAALLRRSQDRTARGTVRVGSLVVDPLAREVWLDDQPVDLSQKEFELLRVLSSDPTRVFTKDELVLAVWQTRSLGSSRTLDSHACRLRVKLAASEQRFVLNVWGVGYRLIDAGPRS